MSSVRRLLPLVLSVFVLFCLVGCSSFEENHRAYKLATTDEARDQALGNMIASTSYFDQAMLAYGYTTEGSPLESQAIDRASRLLKHPMWFSEAVSRADPDSDSVYRCYSHVDSAVQARIYEYFCSQAYQQAGYSCSNLIQVHNCAPVNKGYRKTALDTALGQCYMPDDLVELYLTTDKNTESAARAEIFLKIEHLRLSTAEWFALVQNHKLDDKLHDLVFKKAIQNAYTTTEWLVVFDRLAPEDERRPAALQSAIEVAETAEDWSGIFTRAEHGSELEAQALAKFAELRQDN